VYTGLLSADSSGQLRCCQLTAVLSETVALSLWESREQRLSIPLLVSDVFTVIENREVRYRQADRGPESGPGESGTEL